MTLNPYHFNNPPFHWDNPFSEQYNVLSYGAKGDGVTNDSTAIQAALDAAVANLPATVFFPPGDFAMEKGILLEMTQGDRGLSIIGAGAGVTRMKLTGTGVFTTTGFWHCLRITPSSAPTVGVTDNYLKDILIKDIGFYDDDPEGHAAPISETGSITGGTNALTLSGGIASVANGDAIRIAGAGTAGASHTTTIASGGGTANIVLTDNAVTTVAGALCYSSETNVSEETHGLNIQYGFGVKIINCNFNSIGDEGIELDYCEDAVVTGNKFLNTPASELSGGGAISIKNGCEGITVGNNVIDGYGSGALNVYGINIKIINAYAIKNLIIESNIIRNTQAAGISFNNAAAVTCSNVNMINNVIDNTESGILRTGNNNSEFLNIVGNLITNCDTGLDFGSVAAANNLDLNVSFNTIDTCSVRGIAGNGTRMNFSGNNISNCASSAIHIVSGLEAVIISGGILDTCGGANPVIHDDSTTPVSVVEGVTIHDGQATTSVIQDCASVIDCEINNATETTRHIDGSSAVPLRATGNKLNGGIKCDSDKSNVSNNIIIFSGTPGTNIVRMGSNDDCTVMGNYIEASGTRTAIECTGTYCNTSHNNVRNSHSTTGVITNAGTGAVSQDNIL